MVRLGRRRLRASVAMADWLVCARYNLPMTFRIGIISDTHGLLRPEAERRLAGVDHIIHGGDIGRPEIIDALRRIAPVTAIRGNVDIDDWAIAAVLARWSRQIVSCAEPLNFDPIGLRQRRRVDVID
jgi:putative phosphoesterase